MRRHPLLYEINARILLSRLSSAEGRRVTLAAIPHETWLDLAEKGFDLVWLMGAWQRSSEARRTALNVPGLRQQYDSALPGWSDDDVSGSPYAIYSYTLDASLGEKAELSGLRDRLNHRGMGLILDFVPNHLALDHPWVHARPHLFVAGGDESQRQHPDWFFSPGGNARIAHGRDPYFPPWTDTAQVNFYSAELREALIGELLSIAAVADGVRCDMAMLGLNQVFGRTWGEVLADASPPEVEFWHEAIGRVKERYPSFTFIAESYWGLERTLQELGFDFTYDKALYDNLRYSGPGEVRAHLTSPNMDHGKSVRFIENHDEPRAAADLGPARSRAAAVVVATVPGLRLFHDGQLVGRKVKLPVQLIREPEEATDAETLEFYRRLLESVNRPAFHEGEWLPVEVVPAWPGNGSHQNLLAWNWSQDDGLDLVMVNYTGDAAQGRVRLQLPASADGQVTLRDELSGIAYERTAAEIRSQGLYVALEPWKAHLFHLLSPGSFH